MHVHAPITENRQTHTHSKEIETQKWLLQQLRCCKFLMTIVQQHKSASKNRELVRSNWATATYKHCQKNVNCEHVRLSVLLRKEMDMHNCAVAFRKRKTHGERQPPSIAKHTTCNLLQMPCSELNLQPAMWIWLQLYACPNKLAGNRRNPRTKQERKHMNATKRYKRQAWISMWMQQSEAIGIYRGSHERTKKGRQSKTSRRRKIKDKTKTQKGTPTQMPIAIIHSFKIVPKQCFTVHFIWYKTEKNITDGYRQCYFITCCNGEQYDAWIPYGVLWDTPEI